MLLDFLREENSRAKAAKPAVAAVGAVAVAAAGPAAGLSSLSDAPLLTAPRRMPPLA